MELQNYELQCGNLNKKRTDDYVKQLRQRGLKVTRTKTGKNSWKIRF